MIEIIIGVGNKPLEERDTCTTAVGISKDLLGENSRETRGNVFFRLDMDYAHPKRLSAAVSLISY